LRRAWVWLPESPLELPVADEAEGVDGAGLAGLVADDLPVVDLAVVDLAAAGAALVVLAPGPLPPLRICPSVLGRLMGGPPLDADPELEPAGAELPEPVVDAPEVLAGLVALRELAVCTVDTSAAVAALALELTRPPPPGSGMAAPGSDGSAVVTPGWSGPRNE
jgi:hypothetical protein